MKKKGCLLEITEKMAYEINKLCQLLLGSADYRNSIGPEFCKANGLLLDSYKPSGNNLNNGLNYVIIRSPMGLLVKDLQINHN